MFENNQNLEIDKSEGRDNLINAHDSSRNSELDEDKT